MFFFHSLYCGVYSVFPRNSLETSRLQLAAGSAEARSSFAQPNVGELGHEETQAQAGPEVQKNSQQE